MTDALDAEDDDHLDSSVEEDYRPGRGGELAKRVSGCNFIDISDLGNYSALSPHRKILLMVFLLCLKDRASEVRFEPWDYENGEHGLRMLYVVAEELHELVPPPFPFTSWIIQDLKRLAGLMSVRRKIGSVFRAVADRIDGQSTGSTSGIFRIGSGSLSSEITLTAYPSTAGDRIFLSISEIDPALSTTAHARLWEIFVKRRNGGGETAEPAPNTA